MMANTVAPNEMREFLEVVSRSRAPVILLKIPSQEIVAASPGAHVLLDGVACPVVGRNLRDIAEGEPSGAMPLLAAGRITGFESIRVLKVTGQRRRVWIRALDGSSAAIAVLLDEDANGRAFVPWRDDEGTSPVIGTISGSSMIERVSSEVTELLGYRPEHVVATSFVRLIRGEDIPEVVAALARTSEHKEGVTLRVRVACAERQMIICQLVLLPLEPAPRCAFALLAEDANGPADGRAIAELINRLGRGIRGAIVSHTAASAPLRLDIDLGRLSTRELEVATCLLAGDRVAAIARRLFLSPGTVRNYLSAVFGKLGVNTQQELIEMLRATPMMNSHPDGAIGLGQDSL